MKYKAVIYDIDGTILDTADMYMKPLAKIIQTELHKEVYYKDLYPLVAFTGKNVLRKCGFVETELDRLLQEWIAVSNTSGIVSTLYEGFDEVFQVLQEQGIKQAVVSSKDHEQYEFDVILKRLDSFFETKVLSDDTNNHKPHAEPMLLCIDRLGLQKSEVIYIGDTDVDAQCARNAGIAFAYAAWGPLELNEPADVYLNTPVDILNLI